MKKTPLMLILSFASMALATPWTPPTGSTGAVSAVSVDENGVVVTPSNFKEANNINSSTNPAAVGPDGSLQYNFGGHLAGFTNLFIDIQSRKMAAKTGQNIFRAYNGITNVADAADSNMIYRLSNQSGKSQIELGENGDIGLVLRGDGFSRIGSLELGGVVRTNWYDYAALDSYILTASNLFAGFSTNAMLKSVYAPQNGLLKFFLDGYEQWGIGVDGFGDSPYLWRQNDTPTVTKFTLWSENNFNPATKADSNTVSALASGTDAFEGILLDRKINNWSDIGVTYSNAVRVNNQVTITNDSAWTGWTTTGSLTASNEILLLTGQYLLSPEQSNGVARFEVNSYSSQNGTPGIITLLSGTNEVAYPYYGQDGQLKIIAGEVLPGATAGLYVSAVTLVGYENLTEAAAVKYVAGLRRTDAEIHADDMTSKRYVDAAQIAAEKHADTGLSSYANDPSKTLVGDRLELGNYTFVGSGAWQGANFAQSADRATIGTRLDDDILTLDSGLAFVEIQDVTHIGTNMTLSIYAQNIIGDPTIGVTTNMMVAFTPIAATVTDLGGGYYSAVVDVSGLGSSTGFFRAYGTAAPASAGSVTIAANLLNLAGHTITNVSEIVFTNGWKIACTTNGLEFVQP